MRADRDDNVHGVGVVSRLPVGRLLAVAAVVDHDVTVGWRCGRCQASFDRANGRVGPYYHECEPDTPLCATCIRIVRETERIDRPVRAQLERHGLGGPP